MIVIDATGFIRASLYAVNGAMLGSSSGDNHIELNAAGYKGIAIIETNINGQTHSRKLILK